MPIAEICFRIVPAAKERFKGGDHGYIASVTSDASIPAYFRTMVGLAADPRDQSTARRYWTIFDQDASFVVEAGIRQLLERADTTPEEAEQLQAILDLIQWTVEQHSRAVEQPL